MVNLMTVWFYKLLSYNVMYQIIDCHHTHSIFDLHVSVHSPVGWYRAIKRRHDPVVPHVTTRYSHHAVFATEIEPLPVSDSLFLL